MLLRIAWRAGLQPSSPDLDPYAFEDEAGRVQMCFPAAYALARAFAAAEPDTVIMDITQSEDEYRAGGYQPGERWLHDLLREQRPVFALAREWAGRQQEREQFSAEVERLRGLVQQAAHELRAVGAVHQAARLERALCGK